MAYIHKATVYFIDVGEEFENVKEILEEVECYDGLPNMKLGVDYGTKEFDWDDSVVVNRLDCTGEQAEEFFQNVTPKKIISTYWYRIVLSDNGIEKITDISNYTVIHYLDVYETPTISVSDMVSKPTYWIDVEAESPEQAEYIAKGKVIEYIRNKQFKELKELEEKYFKK